MNLSDFMQIICNIEDVLSMVDRPNISIGTEFFTVTKEAEEDDDEEDSENPVEEEQDLAMKVSFDLKHGWVKVLFYKQSNGQWLDGSINYYDRSNSQIKSIEFDDEADSFWLALKKIVILDKGQSSNKRDSISDSQGNRELDLLRSELSKIN
jgi:hypothetical protein